MATTGLLIINDGTGGCKKDENNPPDVLYGRYPGDISWKITNKCNENAAITIYDIKEKNRNWWNGSLDPFKLPITITVPGNGGTASLTVPIQNVEDPNEKGFHVFRYRIKIKGGGKENKDDPEIIIEWP